ncbi:MAG: ABC transporter substrate-binding protein [Spirochaetaceae bacterium]|nr:ABC transporter substrate-binding protein [Spirochaetaceae bacterium]
MSRKRIPLLAALLVTAALLTMPVFGQVKTYKIGVLAPITGVNAEYGKGFQIATKMAADEINAKGEIKLEMVVRDSKGDAKESADLARQFGDDPSIMAIIGDFTSSACMADAPIIDEAGVVLLSPTASNPSYAAMSKYAFSIMGRQDGEAPFFSTYLLKKFAGAKKVGILWVNSDWGKSAHDNFTRQAKKDGLDIVADVNYIADEKDFSSAIAKLRRGEPDHIILMDQGPVPTIINQIAQAGWKDVKITTLGPGTSQQIIQLCKENAEGLLLTTPFYIDKDNKEATAWADKFTKLAGFAPTVHPACAYDTVYLIAQAIKDSGSKVTRDSIRQNLQDMKGFVGLTGPIQFNPDGDIFRKYLIIQVENGKFVRKTDYDFAK